MEERIKGRLLWKMGNETLTNSHHHMQIMSTIPINIFCNHLSEIKVRVFEFFKKIYFILLSTLVRYQIVYYRKVEFWIDLVISSTLGGH